ncbi:MAG: isoprenylcysteine carboxylmethyltransferase family protein [Rhizobiales bacterium]|nr:isoprenylcysteine carboxylmethyltransferase family protein [Hyphomicrobiales bacterium]MDQ3560280.1 isoprenylcysteine carboxylmethyltransferase family protein [Pseudomonadota bacterium]
MRLVKLGQLLFTRRGLLLPIGIALILLPSPRLADDPALIGIVGLAVALVGQAIRVGTIGLAYIIRGGRDHRVHAEDLVTTGLYSHSRNPMYLGNCFLLAGLALTANSWLFVLVGVPIAIGWHAAIIAAEEDFLRRKFGARFDAYCARVPRLLPRFSGLPATFREMRFDWRRVLLQEYAKPLDWIAAIAMIALVNLWRADSLPAHQGLTALFVLLIVARLALWLAARQLKRGPARYAGSL